MNSLDITTKEDLILLKYEILSEMKAFLNSKSEDRPILKSVDVRKLLNISAGSLQNLRISGQLPFSKVNGTIFYKFEDVMKMINQNIYSI